MMNERAIINNEKQQQFEYIENGELAKLEYRFYKKNIAMMHTTVPESMKGKGVASALAERAFEYAQSINKKVMVYCPFVGAYLKKHPELKSQIDRAYHPNL
ncbi:GNAT family N-acetyltransferase [Polluticaenibacter yanchengensis]|uniref:GNAT family N-acetyltransferase n=1 Tax=Polluticaenibacter yanchengensis TaxID=3014562 RepID=A0ABT4UHI9_9BACT|nr:GNAT family N-acetyltransferase [Chitinophagaceae bacterium LY-5]